MTILNFDAPLIELDGTPALDEKNNSLKLFDIISRLVCGVYNDEPNLPADEKFARGTLAMKIRKGGDIELSVEEQFIIKQLVGKGGSPLAIVQVYNIIEDK